MSDEFHPVIETERLRLRPLRSEDAPRLFEIFSDHEVMRYWNTAPWASVDEAHTFLKESAEAMKCSRAMTVGVADKDSGLLLGKCMLFNYAAESKRAEIGFGVARQQWGKGYAVEAARALLQYAFDTLGLRRIEAEIDPLNAASARTLERLGFVREGLLRQRWEINGVVSDSALYGLLAEDGGV